MPTDPTTPKKPTLQPTGYGIDPTDGSSTADRANDQPVDTVLIHTTEIKHGDRFVADGVHYWTATEDARVQDDEAAVVVVVAVRFRDGGTGQRVWDDPTVTIEVERPVTS